MTPVQQPSWWSFRFIARSAGAILAFLVCCGIVAAQETPPKSFTSPEEAAQALVEACAVNDTARLVKILGSSVRDLVYSGDVISDAITRRQFARDYEEYHKLTPEGESSQILYVGREEWPLPVPIVKIGNAWRFDIVKGIDELLRRRISGNEAAALRICRLYVEMQQQYAHSFHDSVANGNYAQKFMSDPSKHNGLYWPPGGGGERSPASTLVELAEQEGYDKPGGTPKPFRGYFFRILTSQGTNAPGGAMTYFAGDDTGFFAEKLMNRGFALVAFPAKYQSSGVMTFIVNHDGIVYQKDLGDESFELGRRMQEYDPDDSWTVAP